LLSPRPDHVDLLHLAAAKERSGLAVTAADCPHSSPERVRGAQSHHRESLSLLKNVFGPGREWPLIAATIFISRAANRETAAT